MAKPAHRIKVRALTFDATAFRKLRSLNIEFADRLTLIAGHNGIGKSTILGLVANTFGISKGGAKSYFGEPFYANIERIVYLGLEEVTIAQQNPSAAPIVVAEISGITVRKRCAMTKRTKCKRARVVPRTIDKAEGDPVGQDAKLPLPTIFIGIKRLASIGEADEREVSSRKVAMHHADRQLMADFVSSVIVGTQLTTDVTHQSIKGSGKKTVQPGYSGHDALAISLGQDSLGSIATALASFQRLMREQGDSYRGGLLVIDELDVGLHPHAIDRLVAALKRHARQLALQIIATTHSPRLIEAIHAEGEGNETAPDKVVYLVDTRFPRLAEDQSLKAILDDMALPHDAVLPKVRKPVLGIYFEDSEGAQFCDALYPTAKRAALGRKLGVQIKLIPLSIGGSNLISLPDKDPLFRNRVLVVDADTSLPRKAEARGNTVKLPCHRGARDTDRSPENVIRTFLRNVINAQSGPLHDALLGFNVTNPSTDRVAQTFFADRANTSYQREASKSWWVAHWDQLKRWGVLRQWAVCHPDEVGAFVRAFEDAATNTARRFT